MPSRSLSSTRDNTVSSRGCLRQVQRKASGVRGSVQPTPPRKAGSETWMQGKLSQGRKTILSGPFLYWCSTSQKSVQELLRGVAHLPVADLSSGSSDPF